MRWMSFYEFGINPCVSGSGAGSTARSGPGSDSSDEIQVPHAGWNFRGIALMTIFQTGSEGFLKIFSFTGHRPSFPQTGVWNCLRSWKVWKWKSQLFDIFPGFVDCGLFWFTLNTELCGCRMVYQLLEWMWAIALGDLQVGQLKGRRMA